MVYFRSVLSLFGSLVLLATIVDYISNQRGKGRTQVEAAGGGQGATGGAASNSSINGHVNKACDVQSPRITADITPDGSVGVTTEIGAGGGSVAPPGECSIKLNGATLTMLTADGSVDDGGNLQSFYLQEEREKN